MHELGHLLGYPDLSPQAFPYDLMSSSLSAGVRRLPDSVTSAVAQGGGTQSHANDSSVTQQDAAKDAVFAALAQPPSAATTEGTSSNDSSPWWLWYAEE
jgi:hypothetical protein